MCSFIHQAAKGISEHFLRLYLCFALWEAITFWISLSSLKMLSVLWSSMQWDDGTVFHCSKKLLLIDNKMLGEIQCLSLASFCINHWVPLATVVLPIFRDESFSHVPRTWASRDKKWLTPMHPHCQSLTFLQKFLLF